MGSTCFSKITGFPPFRYEWNCQIPLSISRNCHPNGGLARKSLGWAEWLKTYGNNRKKFPRINPIHIRHKLNTKRLSEISLARKLKKKYQEKELTKKDLNI